MGTVIVPTIQIYCKNHVRCVTQVLGKVPGTKKGHQQALTSPYNGMPGETANSETSGFIFYYFTNPLNCSESNSKWTHFETRTIAAKGQSLAIETGTTASWFEAPVARPATRGNNPEGFDLPQCSTYVKSVCQSSALIVPQKAEEKHCCPSLETASPWEIRISSEFTNFLCELPSASSFHMNNKKKSWDRNKVLVPSRLFSCLANSSVLTLIQFYFPCSVRIFSFTLTFVYWH